MARSVQKPGAGLLMAAIVRRRSLMARVFLVLGEILLITSLTGALASADNQTTQPAKGHNSMPQAAKVAVNDVPFLDRSLPGHVETFTFGLG